MKKYVINHVHLFKQRSRHFVFVTDNMLLFECNNETYNNISAFFMKHHTGDIVELNENDALVDAFVKAKVILSYDELNTIAKNENNNDVNALKRLSSEHIVVTNIVLELSNDCNLNCIYCYGSGGCYGRKRELMSTTTAKKAIDFLFNNCGRVKYPHITFFGGEPLLNYEVLKYCVEYCHTLELESDKTFTFSITTNGTICNDEIEKFFTENKIHVLLSIDGSKDIQDVNRPRQGGGGSYDLVLQNINRFKRINGGNLTARATICHPNYDFVDIKKSLLAIGFTQVQMSLVDVNSASTLFVGSKDGTVNVDLINGYNALADDYINTIKTIGISDNKHFTSMLADFYFKNMRITGCGAGQRGFAIGTDELIYPCHRFMGMTEYSVGSLTNGIDRTKTLLYRHNNVIEKEDCQKCWAKFACAGSCSHICVTQENDIMKAPSMYCENFKALYEIVLFIYAELKEWDENVFRNMLEKANNELATIK